MTPKQEAFVREYLIDLNASAAAARAGYSAKTAHVTGHATLKKPEIQAAIQAAMKARAERAQVDADWVLRRLHSEASADLSAIYDDAGNLLPIKQWPMVFRTGLVAGIETVVERAGADAEGRPQFVTVRKVKLADRTRMIEMIGKHIGVGAFKDRLEIEDITDRAEIMRRRREARLAKG